MHSANWPESLDVKDKVVAVLGSGSSGVQLVPTLQPSTSNWFLPVKRLFWQDGHDADTAMNKRCPETCSFH